MRKYSYNEAIAAIKQKDDEGVQIKILQADKLLLQLFTYKSFKSINDGFDCVLDSKYSCVIILTYDLEVDEDVEFYNNFNASRFHKMSFERIRRDKTLLFIPLDIYIKDVTHLFDEIIDTVYDSSKEIDIIVTQALNSKKTPYQSRSLIGRLFGYLADKFS